MWNRVLKLRIKECSPLQAILFVLYPAVVAVIAFFHFSPVFTPWLGSDAAIPILQSHNFRLPEDLYYWGQNRLGSFVPMISHGIFRLTGVSPIWIISIVNQIILLLGCLSFLQFFKTRFAKIVFPLFWFIPIRLFIGLVEVGLPQGVSLSFLSFFLYFRLYKPKTVLNRFLSWTFLFVACWVSDLIFIAAAIFLFIYFLSHVKVLTRNFNLMFRSLSMSIIELFVVVLIVYVFKNITAGEAGVYSSTLFNSWPEIVSGFNRLKLNFIQIFDDPMSFYDILLLVYLISSVLIVVLSGYRFVFKTNHGYKIVHSFFLLYGIAILFIFFASHWVYLNDFRSRYLLDMYVALLVFSLLMLEKRRVGKLLLIPCIAGMIYTIPPYYYPERAVSRLDQLKELEKLGTCGVISIYWFAYEFACIHPDKIMGVPHDKEFNRNPEQTHEVFAQPKIYLCNVEWLDVFPDTISQYGYLLKKTENEKTVSWYRLREYEILEKPESVKE